MTSKMMYEGARLVSSCAKEKFGKIPSLTVSISDLVPQLRLREGVKQKKLLLSLFKSWLNSGLANNLVSV